jgi:hypothetical protein
MDAVVTDVNVFFAGLSSIGAVVDLRYDVILIGSQPERIMCMGSVAYIAGA